MTRALPALSEQTSRRVLALAHLKIQEKGEEEFEAVRFQQDLDMSELQAIGDLFGEAHQDETRGRLAEEIAADDLDEFGGRIDRPPAFW
jgi:hypothetical protein